jgi:response regulator RpfG family c-di-GMP phosphodiesterase
VATKTQRAKQAKLLVVEDDAMIGMLLADMLDELGYTVAAEAASIDEALEAARNGPAEFLQPLQECRVAGLCFGIVCGEVHEHADPPHPFGLLRTRSERPRCRAAEERDEVAPSHANSPVEEKVYQTAALRVTAKLATDVGLGS